MLDQHETRREQSRSEVHEGFAHKVQRATPWLFAVWLFLTVMAPHQDTYKVFFHAVAIPSLLVLLFARLSGINWRDPLLVVALVLFFWAGGTTFVVGSGSIDEHVRAARWALEITFGVLVFYVWLPKVVESPQWWGRLFLSLSILGGLGAFVNFALVEELRGRLSGFGALHNPIQAASVLLVYFAIGQFLLRHKHSSAEVRGDKVLIFSSAVIVSIAVLLSESRAPIGALILYFGFLGTLRFIERPRLRDVVPVLLILAVPLAAIYSLYGDGEYVHQLLDRGMNYRLEIWAGYLNYPPESWWLGFGAGTPPAALPAAEAYWIPNDVLLTHAHNLFVGTLAETGLIGLGLLAAMICVLVWTVLRMNAGADEKLRLFGILGLVLVLSMTSTHTVVSSIKTVWLSVWVPVLFVYFWSLRLQPKEALP